MIVALLLYKLIHFISFCFVVHSFFFKQMLAVTKLPKIVASYDLWMWAKREDLWNSFSRTSRRLICNVTFKLPNGEKKTVQGKEGESVLQVAHRNEIPLEGMNANLSRVDISRCRCL